MISYKIKNTNQSVKLLFLFIIIELFSIRFIPFIYVTIKFYLVFLILPILYYFVNIVFGIDLQHKLGHPVIGLVTYYLVLLIYFYSFGELEYIEFFFIMYFGLILSGIAIVIYLAAILSKK
jgi:hypothetical protein